MCELSVCGLWSFAGYLNATNDKPFGVLLLELVPGGAGEADSCRGDGIVNYGWDSCSAVVQGSMWSWMLGGGGVHGSGIEDDIVVVVVRRSCVG